MKSALMSLLVKLRLFDAHDNTLSLTSLLLMVAIGRLAIFPADVYTTAILGLALANSHGKRFAHHKKRQQDDATAGLAEAAKTEFDKLKSEVQKLIAASNIGKLGR